VNLEDLIRERRSIRRRYKNLHVSQELVKALLQRAEQLCPYEGEKRWRYVYVGTPEARNQLTDYMFEKMADTKMARLMPGKLIESLKKRYAEVPATLIIIAETDPDSHKRDEIYGTICSIMQNFQLLGWEQRLGMLWNTESYIQNELFFKRIGIREKERFVGLLHIGYFHKTPRGRSRTPAERKWTIL